MIQRLVSVFNAVAINPIVGLFYSVVAVVKVLFWVAAFGIFAPSVANRAYKIKKESNLEICVMLYFSILSWLIGCMLGNMTFGYSAPSLTTKYILGGLAISNFLSLLSFIGDYARRPLEKAKPKLEKVDLPPAPISGAGAVPSVEEQRKAKIREINESYIRGDASLEEALELRLQIFKPLT